jgi:hypothetical protein
LVVVFVVSIYNTHKAGSNFVDVFSNLKKLPCYPCDLPSASCAVIGYTVNTSKKDTDDTYDTHVIQCSLGYTFGPSRFKKRLVIRADREFIGTYLTLRAFKLKLQIFP